MMRKITWSGEWVTQDDVVLALAKKGYGVACFDGKYYLTSFADSGVYLAYDSKEELNGYVSLIISDADVEEVKESKKSGY